MCSGRLRVLNLRGGHCIVSCSYQHYDTTCEEGNHIVSCSYQHYDTTWEEVIVLYLAVTNIMIQLERRSLYCILQFTNIMIQLTHTLEFLSLEGKWRLISISSKGLDTGGEFEIINIFLLVMTPWVGNNAKILTFWYSVKSVLHMIEIFLVLKESKWKKIM